MRGAFTNAYFDKDGLLIEANGGTIFLDEIGKTSMAMQGKLLQFLDSGKVRKVGSNELMTVDVRVVCASKSNLLKMVEEGRFLEDFFYRINDFPLTVPPLRERPEDIPLLMHHYIEKIAREMSKSHRWSDTRVHAQVRGVPLAGQRSRAGESRQAGDHPGRRRRRARRPARSSRSSARRFRGRKPGQERRDAA